MSLEELRADPKGVRVPLRARYASTPSPMLMAMPRGFPTPSRKIEFWSETLRAARTIPVAGLRGAAGALSAARSGGALSARAHLRQADGVLPDAAPRACRPAPPRDGSRSGVASRRPRRCAASRPDDWVSVETPTADAGAGASERRDSIHAWWWASMAGGRRRGGHAPGYDPFSPLGPTST